MWETTKAITGIVAILLAISLLFPFGRAIVAGIFGKAMAPAMIAALESVFRWLIHFLKMSVRYVWVILKNLVTPKTRIYQTLESVREKEERG